MEKDAVDDAEGEKSKVQGKMQSRASASKVVKYYVAVVALPPILVEAGTCQHHKWQGWGK